jgi:hypothetical protein
MALALGDENQAGGEKTPPWARMPEFSAESSKKDPRTSVARRQLDEICAVRPFRNLNFLHFRER